MSTYRCVFCRRLTDRPDRPAPSCSACGRQTVRVLERVVVRVIVDGEAP